MLKIKSIIIYPIKGLGGVHLNSAKVYERGLENDRMYMLIDASNNFISQRTHPKIALISTDIFENAIHLRFQSSYFSISLDSDLGEKTNATLFDQSVIGTYVSLEADLWFSNVLGDEVRLIKMKEQDVRIKKLSKGPVSTEVSFADGYPYLIIGTASLDLLNSKLDTKIEMNRFRPNIVVSTDEPHLEDEWENITIGESKLMVIKPCARCQVPTVDQSTGTTSKEPLKTLATYRKKDKMVFFGANAISLGMGMIRVGNEVLVQ